ncbi:MAG TPA: PEGA domain-containing protein [Candidatus Bathyarchaeia archaeon]|nr:PEGA domain-containing protein [Candidatus Bathyarchaeia archaeon]
MAIEYLLVTYPEQRAVLADGNGVGFTNHTLMLPTDEYLITLDGTGYQPASQDVALSGTSLVKPMVISFTPSTPVARAPAPAPPPATPPAPARTGKGRKKNG